MQTDPALSPDALLGAVLPYLVFALIGYAYFAAMLMIIARKTGTPNGWMAWVPIANLVLMCRIARKSAWLVLLLLVPLVNLIVIAVIWAGIARARGRSAGLGVLILVPLVNLLVPALLAMGEPIEATDHPQVEPAARRAAPAGGAAATPAPEVCPNCRATVGAGDAFCGECGHRLATPAAAMPGGEPIAGDRPRQKGSGAGVAVALIVGALLLAAGGYVAFKSFGYRSPERQAPALPQRMAGSLSEFPVDTDPTNPTRPSSVITSRLDPADGKATNVPDDWLPPGLGSTSLPGRVERITSTQYHSPTHPTPVNVHVLETSRGPQTEAQIARTIQRATGGQRTGIQVESPTGSRYQGSRIQTLQLVIFVLVNQMTNNLVIIYAPDPSAIDDAVRLAGNVGNGDGLTDYPELRNALWILPPSPPPGLILQEANTFTRGDFERSLNELDSFASGSPELQSLVSQVRRLLPSRVTTTRYVDGRQQDWQVAVGEYNSGLNAWTTWLLLRGLLSAGGATAVPNGEGFYTDVEEGRLLFFRRGPYIVVLGGPVNASFEELTGLAGWYQF